MEPRTGPIKPEDLLDQAIDALIGRAPDGAETGLPAGVHAQVAQAVRQQLAAEPRPAAKAMHLQMLAGAQRLSAPVPEPARSSRKRLRDRLLAPVAAIGLAALIAAPATAALASEASPGEALYGVKLAVERLRLTIATSDSGRAGLHIAFAERRLEELSEMVAEHRSESALKPVLANLRSHQDAAREELDRLFGGRQRNAGPLSAESEALKHTAVIENLLVNKAKCSLSDPAADPTTGAPSCHGLLRAFHNAQELEADLEQLRSHTPLPATGKPGPEPSFTKPGLGPRNDHHGSDPKPGESPEAAPQATPAVSQDKSESSSPEPSPTSTHREDPTERAGRP